MKKYLLIFWLVFLPSLSFANLSGKWNGTGDLLNFDGKPYGCQAIDLDLSITDSSLKISFLTYGCEEWLLSWDEVNATIANGEVFIEGTKIGTASGEILSVTFYDLEKELAQNFELKLVNGVLHLHDELYNFKTRHTYTRVNAELGRKP